MQMSCSFSVLFWQPSICLVCSLTAVLPAQTSFAGGHVTASLAISLIFLCLPGVCLCSEISAGVPFNQAGSLGDVYRAAGEATCCAIGYCTINMLALPNRGGTRWDNTCPKLLHSAWPDRYLTSKAVCCSTGAHALPRPGLPCPWAALCCCSRPLHAHARWLSSPHEENSSAKDLPAPTVKQRAKSAQTTTCNQAE